MSFAPPWSLSPSSCSSFKECPLAFRFSYLGTQQSPSTPQAGPTATARFLLVPGMQASSQPKPTFTLPSVARGVYEAENVTLDQPGFWNVDVVATSRDQGDQLLRHIAGDPNWHLVYSDADGAIFQRATA